MVVSYDPRKTLGMLALCPVLALLGWFVLTHPDTRHSSRYFPVEIILAGWVCIIGAGFGFVVGIFRLLGRVALRLDERGFDILYPPLNPRRIEWGNVEGFRIQQIRQIKFVKCKIRTGKTTLASVRGDADAREISLPTFLTRPPERVVELMEEWRTRYSG